MPVPPQRGHGICSLVPSMKVKEHALEVGGHCDVANRRISQLVAESHGLLAKFEYGGLAPAQHHDRPRTVAEPSELRRDVRCRHLTRLSAPLRFLRGFTNSPWTGADQLLFPMLVPPV